MRKRYGITLPEIRLDPERFVRTEAKNQIPTTLLFRDGEVADTKLGAQSFVELRDWVLVSESTVARRDSPTSVSVHR
jgi:hypothetical protein